jgi:hypothetical protein
VEQRSITILDPVSLPRTKKLNLNPRPKTMAGIRVAFVDNTKPNFSTFCDRVEQLLVSEYGATVARYRKPGRTVGVTQTIIDEIKATCDFAITGLGD